MLKPTVLKTILYSGGSYCMAEARSDYQIWEALVCIAEVPGVRVFSASWDTLYIKPWILHAVSNKIQNSDFYLKSSV